MVLPGFGVRLHYYFVGDRLVSRDRKPAAVHVLQFCSRAGVLPYR